jgi:hypothetical protein
MPSFVSPAQVQTANGANMYVPIDGDVALLPPIIEGTPITTEKIGVPPFISSIKGIEPITINENVFINYTGSILSTVNSTPPPQSFNIPANALTVNGPVRFSYDTLEGNALDIIGQVEFNTISANALEAASLFNIPITFKDFSTLPNNYGFGQINVFDMGGLRFVYGTTNNRTPGTYQVDPTFILKFNDLPANTIPNQTQTGFFIGKCTCLANFTQSFNQISNPDTFAVNTVLEPGNVLIWSSILIVPTDPTSPSGGQYTFIAIGIAKT